LVGPVTSLGCHVVRGSRRSAMSRGQDVEFGSDPAGPVRAPPDGPRRPGWSCGNRESRVSKAICPSMRAKRAHETEVGSTSRRPGAGCPGAEVDRSGSSKRSGSRWPHPSRRSRRHLRRCPCRPARLGRSQSGRMLAGALVAAAPPRPPLRHRRVGSALEPIELVGLTQQREQPVRSDWWWSPGHPPWGDGWTLATTSYFTQPVSRRLRPWSGR